MKHSTKVVPSALLLLVVLGGALQIHAVEPAPVNAVLRTITLEVPVHFIDSEGRDVRVPQGTYWVSPVDNNLQLLNLQSGQSFALTAAPGQHDHQIAEPMALSTGGTEEEPDVHFLILLLNDGNQLAAEGSYSGIRSRGPLGDAAKRRAEAARRAAAQRALAAQQAAQQAAAEAARLAEAASTRAREAAAEAARLAAETARKIREAIEQFVNLSCEEKLQAVSYASQGVQGRLPFSAEESVQKAPNRQSILDEIFKETVKKHRSMIEPALQLTAAVKNQKKEERIQTLIRGAVCGTNPRASADEFVRIVTELRESPSPRGVASDSPVQSRSVPVVGKWVEPGWCLSFDVAANAVVPNSVPLSAKGGAVGFGIAGSPTGDDPNHYCPMPESAVADRIPGEGCFRLYHYRHAGVTTWEFGVGLPLSVGVWAVNPRSLQGRYTMLGGSISFEAIGLLWFGTSGAAAVFTGGAASGATVPSVLGLAGVGLDFVFDQSLASYIQCAMKSDNWKAECAQLPNVIGVAVSAGISVSVFPIEAHVYGGAEWTWWIKDGEMYDPMGPTPLYTDVIEFVKDKVANR